MTTINCHKKKTKVSVTLKWHLSFKILCFGWLSSYFSFHIVLLSCHCGQKPVFWKGHPVCQNCIESSTRLSQFFCQIRNLKYEIGLVILNNIHMLFTVNRYLFITTQCYKNKTRKQDLGGCLQDMQLYSFNLKFRATLKCNFVRCTVRAQSVI